MLLQYCNSNLDQCDIRYVNSQNKTINKLKKICNCLCLLSDWCSVDYLLNCTFWWTNSHYISLSYLHMCEEDNRENKY